MKWRIKEKEFLRTYPGYELNEDHTIIEHNGNVIHAANGSTPKVYKKSDDIVIDVTEKVGDKQVIWKLFISFDELRPLLTEYDGHELPGQGNIPIENSMDHVCVERAIGGHLESGGSPARLNY